MAVTLRAYGCKFFAACRLFHDHGHCFHAFSLHDLNKIHTSHVAVTLIGLICIPGLLWSPVSSSRLAFLHVVDDLYAPEILTLAAVLCGSFDQILLSIHVNQNSCINQVHLILCFSFLLPFLS